MALETKSISQQLCLNVNKCIDNTNYTHGNDRPHATMHAKPADGRI